MREVEMLMRRDEGKGRIAFVDIASPDYDPEQNGGVTFEQASRAALLPLPRRAPAPLPRGPPPVGAQALNAPRLAAFPASRQWSASTPSRRTARSSQVGAAMPSLGRACRRCAYAAQPSARRVYCMLGCSARVRQRAQPLHEQTCTRPSCALQTWRSSAGCTRR